MKLYKNANNEIFAFELDGSQDHLIQDLIKITDKQAEAIRQADISAAFNALTYIEKRAQEYPSFIDYIDGVVKGDQEQINKYITECLAVKAKYPKI